MLSAVPLPGLLIDTDTASDDAVALVMAAAAAAARRIRLHAVTTVAGNVPLVRRVNADGFRALLFEPCATTPGTAERLRPVMGAAA